jgi:hypothetical protein
MFHLKSITHNPAIVGGLALAALALASPAALAQPSAQLTKSYRVNVPRGVLAQGTSIDAKAVVLHGTRSRAGWWSRATVAKVVRAGVTTKRPSSYRSHGYRCVAPGSATSSTFRCIRNAKGARTRVKLSFQAGWLAPMTGSPILPLNLSVNVATGSAGQQQLTVPTGVTSAVVIMQGGTGDRSQQYYGDRVGAAVTGTLSVTPGEVLTVGAGTKANGATGGWGPAGMSGGLGGGVFSTPPVTATAGGGGGASAILDGSTPLMVAGGGGGNGQNGNHQCAGTTGATYNGFGGSGGAQGVAVLDGTACTAYGVTATGGAGGGMPTGTGGAGGPASTFALSGGGGGGGGYLGGVGGGTGIQPKGMWAVGGGGGGAGTSYVDASRVSLSSITGGGTGNGSLQIYWIGSGGGWVPANGQTQTITPPAGATQVSFTAFGGAGGSTGGVGNAGRGGNGAQVLGSYAVAPGQTFQITPGGRGQGYTTGGGHGSPGGTGLAAYLGGAGGSGGGGIATGGAGGGAATIIQSNGSTLVVAGGGGGAGAGSDDNAGTVQHGNGGGAGATPDNGSTGFGTDGGGSGKGGYGPTSVGQSAAGTTSGFTGGGGGAGVLGGSAGTTGGILGSGGGGGAGSSVVSSALPGSSVATAPWAEAGFVIITWTIG